MSMISNRKKAVFLPLTNIPAFDDAVMTFVQNFLHNALTDFIFPVITYLGEGGFIWILTAVVLLFFKKTRTTGILVLITMLFTFVTGELILKNLICRPRPCHLFPDVPLLVGRPDSFSFPSGHSASSFTAAVMLTLRHKKAWPALLLAAAIAFSRVFLFVHFPTYILAGALLGTLFAFTVYFVFSKMIRTEKIKKHS